MVKLADRISNLQPPPDYWNAEKIGQYREGGRTILNALSASSQYLAKRLKKKIGEYTRYSSGIDN